MKKKRREFYQKGLESWRDILLRLEMATDEECPVCNINKCHQYAEGSHEASQLANDCPLKGEPDLCRKLRYLKEELSNLFYEVDSVISQIKGLHAKEGILHEE